jgi:hypothetical protein
MKSALVVVGLNSYVLSDYKPKKRYHCVFQSFRDIRHANYKGATEAFELDLMNCSPDYGSLLEKLADYDDIDIIFTAYSKVGVSESCNFRQIQEGLSSNCGQPIYFFHTVSSGLPGKRLRGVFISSIYAHVAPKPKNYEADSNINPLYYGIAKAGVEQGLRWLSIQDPNHTFNSIVLGPMPKKSVRSESPMLIQNLINSMSSNRIVEHNELHSLIDYLLGCGISTRGVSYNLDGGYLCY